MWWKVTSWRNTQTTSIWLQIRLLRPVPKWDLFLKWKWLSSELYTTAPLLVLTIPGTKLNTWSWRSATLWDAPTEGKSTWLVKETWSTCTCSCNCMIAEWWLWVRNCAVVNWCSYWETMLQTAFWMLALWLCCKAINSSCKTDTWLSEAFRASDASLTNTTCWLYFLSRDWYANWYSVAIFWKNWASWMMSPNSKPPSSTSHCNCCTDVDIVVELVSTDRVRLHNRNSLADSYLICKLQRRNFLLRNLLNIRSLRCLHPHGSWTHIITRLISPRWLNLKNWLQRQFCLWSCIACLWMHSPLSLATLRISCPLASLCHHGLTTSKKLLSNDVAIF